MMNSSDRHRVLADELRCVLNGASALSDTAMHYIDSTFASPTTGELQSILTDVDNCERDPLLELIYSPDEDTQIRLEAILERSAFLPQDRSLIADHLMNPPTVIQLTLSRNRGQVAIPLTPSGASRLIGLLHIEKHLDPALRRAVDAYVDKDSAARVKVIFRNARCKFCSRDVAFLARALAGLDLNRQTDVGALEYALEVLADSPSPADIYAGADAAQKNLLKAVANRLEA